MMAILLTGLKVLGIALASVFGLLLVMLLLVLFVPIRYRLDAQKPGAPEEYHIQIKISWLLHLLRVGWSYPQAAFVRVRLLCFTVFRSDKPRRKRIRKKKPDEENLQQDTVPDDRQDKTCEAKKEETEYHEIPPETAENDETQATGKQFVRACISVIRKLKYTIQTIYDKIKNIIENFRYYWKIIRSDLFRNTWKKCSAQAISLIKRIVPYKIDGYLKIGMDDPATTGQILAYYGMLYPWIGDNIQVVPDFEQVVLEGNLLLKGKITLYRILKTAWIIYFNKDLRKLIHLLKREDV